MCDANDDPLSDVRHWATSADLAEIATDLVTLEEQIEERTTRIALALFTAIGALSERLDALERPSRWSRVRAWLRTNVYEAGAA